MFLVFPLICLIIELAVMNGSAFAELPLNPDSAVQPRIVAVVEKPEFRYRNETLHEDVSWRGTVLIDGWVSVAPQTTLSIEPGAVIRFQAKGGETSGLLVAGRLRVNGTATQPVVFTSGYVASSPSDWQGIVFAGTEKKNQLSHFRIEGAETALQALFSSITASGFSIFNCKSGLLMNDSNGLFSNGTMLTAGTGVSLNDSEAELLEVTVTGGVRGIAASASSLFLSGSSLSGNSEIGLHAVKTRVRLHRSIFSANAGGIWIADSEGSVTGSRITDNKENGIEIINSRIRITGSDLSGNAVGVKSDTAKSLLYGNAIHRNAKYNFYYAGKESVIAGNNWWGTDPQMDTGQLVYDRTSDFAVGKVIRNPLLTRNPVIEW